MDRAAAQAWGDAILAAEAENDPAAILAVDPRGSAGRQALIREQTVIASMAQDEALAALPEPQRRAWTLRELGGLGYEEIAEELGLPVSTVRGLLARARRTLVQQLDGWR